MLKMVGFDGDDTLWRSEDYYREANAEFAAIVGAYADLALCDVSKVFPLADHVSFAQGAALGVPAGTAYKALFLRGQIKAGETLLIHGATGGSTKDTLDPHRPVTAVDIARVCNLYEPLLFWDDNYQIAPAVAESVTPSKDAKTWTVKLRDGVTFHNGKPVTPADVIFTIKRVANPKAPTSAGGTLSTILDFSGLKALEELKSAGTIAAYGLGVNEVEVCLEVLRRAPLDCILLAGRYSLLDRSAEAELIPLCRDKQTSLVIGGVFNSGILATGPRPGAHFDYGPAPQDVLDKVAAMEEIARQGGYPLAAAAMQFPLAEPCVATVLIGSAKASSIERNMALPGVAVPRTDYETYRPYTIVQSPLTGAVRE